MKELEDAKAKLQLKAAGYVCTASAEDKPCDVQKIDKANGARLRQKIGSFKSLAEAAEVLGLNKPQGKAQVSSKTPKVTAKRPVAKRPEPKSTAPKNEPVVAKKPASAKKNAADKLLIHNDKDEMKVGGEKPSVINGANVKPKKAPKVLRRVAKTGGYTVWDDIKRSGKTFATEKEAKDYAADLLKKTGKIAPISPTDRQVTHSFKPEAEKQKK